MGRFPKIIPAIAALALALVPAGVQPFAQARKSDVSAPVKPLTYADVAERVLAAPLVVQVKVKAAKALPASKVSGLAPGQRRYLMTGDVMTLIRGEGGIPPRITWLADLSADARGKYPKLAKMQLMIAARRVPGFPNEVQLIAPDAQFAMTPDAGLRVRPILAAALDPQAPPRVTGITDMFHTAGSLPGEGETQIFLSTALERPISLSLVRRSGSEPMWGVNLGESVGDSLPPPLPESLLWYRLACALPASPPASATSAQSGADVEQALADYRHIRAALGPCQRQLPALPSKQIL